MIKYNKDEIKEQLTTDNIFELLYEWGGEPEHTSFGLISSTICHNLPGEGSRKLYFYNNSSLFRCYTGCDSYFDIFELYIKVANIQHEKKCNLFDAMLWIAKRFGISGEYEDEEESERLEDWKILAAYDRIKNIKSERKEKVELKEYDISILKVLNYKVKISPWLNEGISQEALDLAKIGYYPGKEQITIPHFDIDGRFVGLRGRALVQEEAKLYGKYKPIRIMDTLYNHPLGVNLYGLNWNKENIKKFKKAIVFESEKSVLLYESYFGRENNIAVACCGSSLSPYQMQLLIDVGATEIIIAFDRQFQEIDDKEFKHLTKNLIKIHERYKNFVLISFIFDKKMITGYKDSPIDNGESIFLQLFKERIIL